MTINKKRLKKIIKEELQTALKEATSTTLPLDDLKVVIDALGSHWETAGDGGLIGQVRKIGMEAKKRAPVEHIGTSNTLLWIAGKCADAAWKMSQAKKDLSDATQRREDLLALEAQRKDDE
jgi:hypothetical protein